VVAIGECGLEYYKLVGTPEEIEKWCTKEDLSELRRCVHILRKGYEI
jgi:Tat protein secretion system quality control protein TatD with DNase activity